MCACSIRLQAENESIAEHSVAAKNKTAQKTSEQVSANSEDEMQDVARIVAFPQSEDVPCDVVYANHDYFDRELGFHDPQFKPIYSPDLLYSYFYAGPLIFVSHAMITAISQAEGFSSDAFRVRFGVKSFAKSSANRNA